MRRGNAAAQGPILWPGLEIRAIDEIAPISDLPAFRTGRCLSLKPGVSGLQVRALARVKTMPVILGFFAGLGLWLFGELVAFSLVAHAIGLDGAIVATV